MIYLYIMGDPGKKVIHFGYCGDIVKAMKFYSEMPYIDEAKRPHLVYLEIYNNDNDAKKRFGSLANFSRDEKIALVETINPTFTKMVPGVNIEI